MKKVIFSIVLFGAVVCRAQTFAPINTNAFSLELGKTGLIYNLVFDHKLQGTNFGFRLTIGSNFAKYLQAFVVGGGGYYLVGKKNKFLELGADMHYLTVDEVSDDQKGFAPLYPDYSVSTYYASLNVGYRKYSKRTLFRVGLSPGFIKYDFVPGGYISFGIVF